MGFEKYSVAELRQMLVDNNIKTEEEAAEIKGKANLVYELKLGGVNPESDENENDVSVEEFVGTFKEIEEVENPSAVDEGVEEKEPMPCDPEWKDYVLSHFTANELFEVNGEKYPSLAGLRRVTELLLGDVMVSGPVDHRTSHPDTNNPLGACTVIYEVQVAWKLGVSEYLDMDASMLPVKIFRGMAGANQNNIDGDFGLYPEAIAETRAEARALRKALSLSVVAYDELCNKKVENVLAEKTPVQSVVSDWNPEDMINETQKTTIMFKCDQLGIDVMKFINSGSKQYESIDSVTKGTAAAMIKRVSSYGQEGGSSNPIPDEIKK